MASKSFFSFTTQQFFFFGLAFFFFFFGFLGFLINWSNRKYPAVNPAMILTLAVCATRFDNYIVSHDYKLKLLHCDKENPSLSNRHPVCISLCTSASKREYIFSFEDNWNLNIFHFSNLLHFFSFFIAFSFNEYISCTHLNNTFSFMLNTIPLYLHIGNS